MSAEQKEKLVHKWEKNSLIDWQDKKLIKFIQEKDCSYSFKLTTASDALDNKISWHQNRKSIVEKILKIKE